MNEDHFQNGIVTLTTYPMTCNEEFDDNHLLLFQVRLKDLEQYISRVTDWTMEEFFDLWTWDNLIGMPESLERLGLLMSQEIIER